MKFLLYRSWLLFSKSCIPIGCIIVLSSCGTRFAYNSLDLIIPWFISDYVSFNDEQDNLLDKALAQHLQWHRVTQLPLYIKFLDDIQNDVQTDITYAHVNQYYERSQQLWKNLVTQITPDIIKLLKTVNEAQIAELSLTLEEQNDEHRSEFVDLTNEELHEGRVERMKERFERWLDELTPEQEKRIELWSHELRPINQFWLDNRVQWISLFKSSLKVRDQYQPFHDQIYTLFMNYDQMRAPEYVTALNYNQEQTIRLIVDVENNLKDSQRQYLIKEVNNLKHDLIKLNKDNE